jgi:hypothetical protein
MSGPQDPIVALLAHAAAAYPDATQDFPWGERVAKVGGGKVFVFLGVDESTEPSVSLKLPRSAHYALSLESCRPTRPRPGQGRLGHDPARPAGLA